MLACTNQHGSLCAFSKGKSYFLTTLFREEIEGPLLSSGSSKACHFNSILPTSPKRTGGGAGGWFRGKVRDLRETT